MRLHLGHLYPLSMSTYGDTGNIRCLEQRLLWRDIDVTIHPLEIGRPIPEEIHLYFFGGGQDAAQTNLSNDLLTLKGPRILEDVQKGVPLLAICGGYQLLGEQYIPFNQDPIPGLGLFPVKTQASTERMIGNLLIEVDSEFQQDTHTTVVGFENHSGKTTINGTSKARPFGKVLHGFGNNGNDHTEGCVTLNAIGCYLHGSLLPKNPHIADWLITKACEQVNPYFKVKALHDDLEWRAHTTMLDRYR